MKINYTFLINTYLILNKKFLCSAAVAGLVGCGQQPDKPLETFEVPVSMAHCIDARGSKHIDLVATSSGLFLGRAARPAAGTATALYDPVSDKPLGATLGLENGYAVVDYGRGPVEKFACSDQSLTLKR
jgi:hypothetical protein